jgi:hypothetical protein
MNPLRMAKGIILKKFKGTGVISKRKDFSDFFSVKTRCGRPMKTSFSHPGCFELMQRPINPATGDYHESFFPDFFK